MQFGAKRIGHGIHANESLETQVLLKDKNVEVTRLAHGLPMGANLDYADELTLIKAFEGRKKL